MQHRQPFVLLQPALISYLKSGKKQDICDFTDASLNSVRRWVVNSNSAKGIYEIRLWHFLLAAGYDFEELSIDEWNFYVAQLIAYSVITIEEAKQLCGVKNSQAALQIMRGQTPAQPAMSLDEMREMYDVQLQAVIDHWQESLCIIDKESLPALPAAPVAVESESAVFDVLVPVLAATVKGVIPLVRLALESWTPAQRARLRELAGDEMFEFANDMHNLSQILNALNSERARAQFEGK